MSKRQFKAESRRLLDLMINSIYTHREIFLRELISNASDAIDKLCYRSLTDETVGLSRGDFRITITPDEKAGTLTVSDNGIGMTEEELEQNLGVIAASGTRRFREELAASDKADAPDTGSDVIGQFGVGFYSAFMVAKKVTVLTRAFGQEKAHRWVSSGADGYTITEDTRDAAGTDVILELKDDTEEEKTSDFLKTWRLENLIKKYSDYIRWPIQLEGKTINSMIPLWQKPKSEADDEACFTFYKTEFGDASDPLTVIRVNAEGLVSYRALLFVPSHPPFDYFTTAYKPGLRLYASGVQVMDKCPSLIPEYFRFVQGVVDSPDLSLNISREMLQHDRQLKVIATNIEKKVKAELLRLMKEEPEKYDTFFQAFGIQLKYGILNDFGAKKDELSELLLFLSGAQGKQISLRQYADAMPEGQKAIYYACGEDEKLLGSLPQAERVRQKGYDVLYLTEEADSFVMNMLEEYDGKPLQNIAAGDLDLGDEPEKDAAKEADEENKDLLDFVTGTLAGAVKKTVISRKLVSAPVCLSTEGEITMEMEQYFRRLSQTSGTKGPELKADRVLELNPDHPVFAALQKAFAEDKDKAAGYARLLYGQALLLSGRMPEDPGAFCGLVSGLMG